PLPATRIAMAVRGTRPSFFGFDIRSNIPREVRDGQGLVTIVTGLMPLRSQEVPVAELCSAGQVRHRPYVVRGAGWFYGVAARVPPGACVANSIRSAAPWRVRWRVRLS